MKLSKRLKHIEQMVTSDYTHIWDCCCDHGFLGASLLSRQANQTIHFVDIVPDLIAQVESKLRQFYSASSSSSSWKVHCIDVATLPLVQYQGKHLIIIAGVGGDLMLQFINDIYLKHPNLAADFILCPVNNAFSVRKKLRELNFSLQREVLVEDNQRFYEIMLVSSISDLNKPVSAVGEAIWQATTDKQAQVVKQYLQKTLNHYCRMQQGNSGAVTDIINTYRTKIHLNEKLYQVD